MIGHIITDNTAIKLMYRPYGIGLWRGYERRKPGFSVRRNTDLLYSDPRTSRVLIAININVLEYENIYPLLYQPDQDWHRNPDTGLPVLYRYLEPVEWLFE